MNDKGFLHRSPETWGKAPETMIHDPTLTDGAVRLYAHMHWRYGKNEQNFEGRRSMAALLHVSETTISNRIAELVSHDWIVAVPRSTKKGRTSNFYHVFEAQADCRKWKNDREIITGLKQHERTLREGKGGQPTHKPKSTQVDDGNRSVDQLKLRGVDQPELTALSRLRDHPDSESDSSFTNVHDESGAPSDLLGKEIDDLPETPQLKIAKAAKAIATLSKRSESEQEVSPAASVVQSRLYEPGEVQVRRGKVSIADGAGNMKPACSEFYVILPELAIGPFKAIGKELLKVVKETGGRVSNSGPEGRSVEAPPGKVKPSRGRYFVEEREGIMPWVRVETARLLTEARKLLDARQKEHPLVEYHIVNAKDEVVYPRPRNALLDALAGWCYGNVDAAFKMRGVPASLNQALGEIKAATPDVTPEQIGKAQQWWNDNDWRGQKGQRPEPHQVPAAWLKFMNGDGVYGFNGNTNTNGNQVLDGGGGPDRSAAETGKFWH